ncbi:MAG TPA: signal peptidase I [Puia sp.]|nr:signal peptidase I [Puia sp.]
MKPLIVATIVWVPLIGLWIIGRLTFTFRLSRVSTSANQPTLKIRRFIFTSSLKKPGRFNLICYRALTPETGPAIWTHRLCGIPGDTIEIKAGILYVNQQDADKSLSLMHVYKLSVQDTASLIYDQKLAYTIPPYSDTIYIPLGDEYVRRNKIPGVQYILPPGLREPAIFRIFRENWNQDHFGPVKVPKGKFFVLGDNRSCTMDSRYQGFIDQSKYLGTVLWK